MGKILLLFIFICSFLIYSPKGANAATLDLTATADTFIKSSDPGNTYGPNTLIDVMRSDTGKARVLVKFDLSTIPSNATVSSANFSIYFAGCGIWNQDYDALNITRVKTTWTENSPTWNTHKDSFDMATEQNTVAPCNTAPNWMTYNVATFVQNWVDGSHPNYGFGLYGDESSGDERIKIFYSKENSVIKPPTLLVNYSVPAGSENPSSSNNENATDSDTVSSSDSFKLTIQPIINNATASATLSADLDTSSSSTASTSKNGGITAVKIALLLALILATGGVGSYYFLIYRKKKKSGAVKDSDKPNEDKEEKNPKE